MMWDFWSLSPESLHQVTILFSDRGTPDGYRHMDGFSSHTFSLINAKNELFYVKWHFKTKQGIKNFFREQAGALEGADPDYSQRDLFHAIKNGNSPKWRVSVQIMPEKDAETYHLNPFDLTKVWPHKDYPLHEVGELELNRNPENYFAEVEQAAFEPRNVVPGMGFSPDKMLQARLTSPDMTTRIPGVMAGAGAPCVMAGAGTPCVMAGAAPLCHGREAPLCHGGAGRPCVMAGAGRPSTPCFSGGGKTRPAGQRGP